MSVKQWLFIALLLPLVQVLAPLAHAQACDTDQIIQVCELDSRTTFVFDPQVQTLGSVDFRIISKREKKNDKPQGVKYRVRATETSTAQFTLRSTSGSDQIDVTLTYINFNGMATALTPGAESAQQDGTPTFADASIRFDLATAGIQPASGVYQGYFQLELNQSAACADSGCQSTTASFDVELVVDASIRISGLEDMWIDYPVSTATQTFCVFTSAGLDFGIRADSQNGTGEFLLLGTGGTGDTVNYQVSTGEVSSALVTLTEGVSTLNQGITWAGNPSADCATGGENMQLEISLDPAAINNAVETNYTDTITLTVELQ